MCTIGVAAGPADGRLTNNFIQTRPFNWSKIRLSGDPSESY